MVSKAHKELEHFFGTRWELEDKHKRGDVNYLHYMLRRSHQREIFAERCPMGSAALDIASSTLTHWTLLSRDQREAKEFLSKVDNKASEEWHKDYERKSLAPLAYAILAGLEAVEVPTIPEPSAEATERLARAYYHQIAPMNPTCGRSGTSMRPRDEAKHSSFAPAPAQPMNPPGSQTTMGWGGGGAAGGAPSTCCGVGGNGGSDGTFHGAGGGGAGPDQK